MTPNRSRVFRALSGEAVRDAIRRRIVAAIAVVSLLSLLVVDGCTACGTPTIVQNGVPVQLPEVAGWAGLVIFAVGMFVANVAARTIREGGSSQAALLATAARTSILVLAAAMGLREMGVGEDIVRLAFGLLVGAVAVALAVAFGIGGRNVAQRKLEQWTDDIEGQGKR